MWYIHLLWLAKSTREWPPPPLLLTPGCSCTKSIKRITSGLISMYQKSSFLSIKYRMLSYLPVGLSAERSYFQRKAHIISFFSSFWSWRHTFFFIKLIKHTSSTKYINYKKFCQKLFLELNNVRFKMEKNTTEKMGWYVLWAHVYFDV